MKFIFLFLFGTSTCVAQEFAIVNFHSTEYNIIDAESAFISESYSIKILSDKGKMYGIFRDYTDRFRKLTDIELVIYDQHGEKVKKLKKNDGIEIGFNPSYEISDAKTFYLDPNYEQYPYTIEVKFLIKLNGFISFPTWVPRPFYNLTVKAATLMVSYPDGYAIKFRENNVGSSMRKMEKRNVASFSVKNLPSVDKKKRYEDFYQSQPKVYVIPTVFRLDGITGSNLTWAEFGNWYLFLNSDDYKLNDKTKTIIDSLRGSNPKAIIARLYQHMQNNTRYVSIQLGIGGFKSLPTEDVEKHGYGDCKALTTYMKNMLASAGINSNYVLVKAGKNVPDAIADMPSNQFNHVFLGIPLEKDTLFLECTNQLSPVNYTGSFTDDRNVLWVMPDGSRIVRSRVYPYDQNVQSTKSTVTIDSVGHADITMESEQKGIFFDELMLYQMAPADYVKDYNSRKFDFEDFSINDFRYSHPRPKEASFVSAFKVRVNYLLKKIGDRNIMPVLNVNPVEKHIDKDHVMKYYSVKRGFTLSDEISIKLYGQNWIYNKPEPLKIESPFGSYESAIDLVDGTIVIKRKVIIYKGEYTDRAYIEFHEFFQKVERFEHRALVLNSKT